MSRDDNDLDEFGLAGADRIDESVAFSLPVGLEAQADVDAWNKILGAQIPNAPGGTNADDILGMLSKQSPAFQNYLAKRIARNAPVLQQIPRTKTKRHMIGFGPVQVPPGVTTSMQERPGIRFLGEKLISTGEVDDLCITGLFVGSTKQWPPGTGPISVHHFHNSISNGARLDICEPGLDITIQVQNTGKISRKFSMAIAGRNLS